MTTKPRFRATYRQRAKHEWQLLDLACMVQVIRDTGSGMLPALTQQEEIRERIAQYKEMESQEATR